MSVPIATFESPLTQRLSRTYAAYLMGFVDSFAFARDQRDPGLFQVALNQLQAALDESTRATGLPKRRLLDLEQEARRERYAAHVAYRQSRS